MTSGLKSKQIQEERDRQTIGRREGEEKREKHTKKEEKRRKGIKKIENIWKTKLISGLCAELTLCFIWSRVCMYSNEQKCEWKPTIKKTKTLVFLCFQINNNILWWWCLWNESDVWIWLNPMLWSPACCQQWLCPIWCWQEAYSRHPLKGRNIELWS